ncbi:MAG: HAD-IC family P-type ATPase, partial [Paracoccaceae bacterium]|nr:HAD-IC family P-type ATPase [Paracoccaceae bacterium]
MNKSTPAPEQARSGLTTAAAKARLAADGPNELATTERRSAFRIVLDVLKEPMLLLLLVGGVVYLLLGSKAEALILLAFACMSIGITAVQEARTSRVLEALRDLSSPRALVIRDGTRLRIAGRDVVRGDLIVLSEGDRVPADAMLIEATDLSADESLLTGEAEAVRKRVGVDRSDVRPGGHDLPQVFSGTLIVRGSALAEVTATGAESEIGKIGKSLSQIEPETPHLQSQMRRLVIATAAIGVGVSAVVVVLYGVLRGGWLDAVLAGIAVGMAMLPEEFPMVLAVFMAMGAWRISKARVLTRRASAIEALGSASVLCTDKTGTLTENRMAIAALQLAEGTVHAVGADAVLPPAFQELAAAGVMASAPEPFDPMEKAFHALAADDLREGETLPGTGRTLIRSYPLTPDLLAMSQVWEAGDGFAVAAKGAPEAVADLCKLTPDQRAAVTAQLDAMAAKGLRVLAVAEAAWPAGQDLPAAQTGFAFRLLGLVGLADPLRAAVPAAVAECQAAGIRVIMITGDHPVTARAIAAEAGLPGDVVLTGDDLAEMAEDDLAEAVTRVTIFARILPEQKLRIVNALKAKGAVVAMTGDGVNDAPSL